MSDNDDILKKNRKKPIFDPSSLPVQQTWNQDAIKRIIPHRPPLLFVDELTALDYEQGKIAGIRRMRVDDPVFSGHFPDFPVYPGNFMVETIGQLGLCMYYFVANKRGDIAPDAKPMQLRATKIAGALFQEPILPGAEVQILAQRLSFDTYFASIIGQAIVNGKVAVVTIGEVMVLDE